MTDKTTPVIAGGAVCWKQVDGDIKILVVHRTQHKDVSLPKGKLDPGETVPECARREILEETGLHVVLGAYLGRVDYTLPGGKDKEVHYWAAEVDPGEAERAPFESNDEIYALEWLPLSKVSKRLTYPHDVDIVETFQGMVEAGVERTFPIIVLRHGKAMPPENWDGPDHSRPLLQRGLNQAQGVSGGIAAFGPTKLISSPATRCLATIEPTSRKTGIQVTVKKSISQDSYDSSGEKARKVIRKVLKKQQGSVLCSHGPVLPQLVLAATESDARPQRPSSHKAVTKALSLSTGHFAVIHVARSGDTPRVVSVEVHEPPTP